MDDSELERCIKLYRRSVLGAALCYVHNTSDAEDIAFATDPDVLDCNANGRGGECVYRWHLADVRRSDRAGAASGGWIGVFNRSYLNDLTFRFVPSDFGFTEFPAAMRDVWGMALSAPSIC